MAANWITWLRPFQFEESGLWQNKEWFRCNKVGDSKAALLPLSVYEQLVEMLRNEDGVVSHSLLIRIKDCVEKWYHDEGYAAAQLLSFEDLNVGKDLVCEVAEGDITDVVIEFQDHLGNVVQETAPGLAARLHRDIFFELQTGNAFNIEAAKQAMRTLNSMGMLSDIEVNPRTDGKGIGGIVVQIILKASPPSSIVPLKSIN